MWEARVTLSTTTHGNGERLGYLKRNFESLDESEFQNWLQIVVVDHSPLPVVQAIKTMILETKYPHRRRLVWLHGKQPTGVWGKFAHNIALQLCQTEFFAFYCDDNFYAPNHLTSLIEILDSNPELGFAFSFACHCASGNLYTGFRVGHIDLGCPLFRTELFRKHLPSLAGIRNVYTWDWEMISFLGYRTKFDTSGLVTFFFGKNFKGNWRSMVSRFKDFEDQYLIDRCRQQIDSFKPSATRLLSF